MGNEEDILRRRIKDPSVKEYLSRLTGPQRAYGMAIVKFFPKPVKIPRGVNPYRANYIKTILHFRIMATSDNKNYCKQGLIRYNPLISLDNPSEKSKKKKQVSGKGDLLLTANATFNPGNLLSQMPLSSGKKVEVDWSKIRRRIEDKLRKGATQEQLLQIAKILGVKIGFGLD